METKWIVILVLGVIVIMFAPLIISDYQKNTCRIEAIKAGVEADKVNTACGVK